MNSEYTNYPKIYVINCILTSLLRIPLSLCVFKLLMPIPLPEDYKYHNRYRFRLMMIAALCTFTAHLAHIGVSIWDLDTPYWGKYDMHTTTGTLTFLGYQLSALFVGIVIHYYKDFFPKYYGTYGTYVPISSIILFGFVRLNTNWEYHSSAFEWLMLLLIVIWTTILWVYILRNIPEGKEIKVENKIPK